MKAQRNGLSNTVTIGGKLIEFERVPFQQFFQPEDEDQPRSYACLARAEQEKIVIRVSDCFPVEVQLAAVAQSVLDLVNLLNPSLIEGE